MTESFVTAAEIAALLGFTADTILDWHEAGLLPSHKIGSRVRFRISEVLLAVEEGRAGRRDGPRGGGSVSPIPTAPTARGVLSQASPIPNEGGSDAC